MTKQITRTYSDLDLDFKPHPLTGDISRKFDAESIKRSVRNLILLNKYEKPFHPEIGSSIRELLFEPMVPLTAISLETRIHNMVDQFEPRVKLNDVVVQADYINNYYEVTLVFTPLNSLTPVETKLFLQRIR